MTTDVTNVQNAYQMILRIAVRAPLMMICSMVMCFVINPTLSLIFLGALIFLGFVLFFIIYKVTPIFTEGFAKYDDLNASVQENVTGIRVVKAFVREDHENKKFSKAAENLIRHLLRRNHGLHSTSYYDVCYIWKYYCTFVVCGTFYYRWNYDNG